MALPSLRHTFGAELPFSALTQMSLANLGALCKDFGAEFQESEPSVSILNAFYILTYVASQKNRCSAESFGIEPANQGLCDQEVAGGNLSLLSTLLEGVVPTGTPEHAQPDPQGTVPAGENDR